jgi:hypothetical protein
LSEAAAFRKLTELREWQNLGRFVPIRSAARDPLVGYSDDPRCD